MRYSFKPNARIQLRLGEFRGEFIRAYRKIGRGKLGEESDAVVLDGKTVFEFFNLRNMDVLDGAEWSIIDDRGFRFSIDFAETISGNLVRVVAIRDVTSGRIDMAPFDFAISDSLLLGFSPTFAFGGRP